MSKQEKSPPRRLPSTKTPISEQEIYDSLRRVAPRLGSPSVCLLMAHWALETGRGKKCVAFNVGNIKAPKGKDHCYFSTIERYPTAKAVAMHAASTPEASCEIVSMMPSESALVRFNPDHRECRFLAYDTLDEGVADYVHYLNTRFKAAWPLVLKGDPVAFCSKLKAMKYFTADEAVYTKAVTLLFREYSRRFQNGISSSSVCTSAKES